MPKDNIVDVDLRKQYMSDMQRYSFYILYDRYVPSSLDGLKPVQRRILYCMWNDIKCVSVSTKRKSANTTGMVIAKYHPHCLDADTYIYNLVGDICIKIGEAYNSGVREFETLGINEFTGKVEPVIVRDLRIGQYTNKIYHIQLSNGTEIKCTGNHPFMLNTGNYITADNIKPGTILCTRYHSLYKNSNDDMRPAINGKNEGLIQDIVWDFYNKHIENGFVKHHIDGNKFNNSITNLIKLSRADHAKIHNNYYKGLDAGRQSIANPNSISHTINQIKNSKLMKIYNKDQNFRKFKFAINILKDRNIDITENNYESLRKEIYNLPKISRLIESGYGNNFNELINNELPSIGELYNNLQQEYELMYHLIPEKEEINYYDIRLVRYCFNSNMNNLINSGIAPNYNNYLATYTQYDGKLSLDDYNILYSKYCNEYPFVTNVWVENVNNIPMYDFTVDTTHNMLIPVPGVNNSNKLYPMICVHNSDTGVYDAMKVMTNWFESKVPLINYDSNSGSLQGGPQAAARYTESYLSKFSVENLLADLGESKQCVDWAKTFDNHTEEPVVLPVKVPLLLVNGTFGIAIGRRIEVPKHSLNDVIDATLALMHNPKAPVILIPDPCQKCEIVDTDWKKISNMGFGYFVERGIIKTVTEKNGSQYLSIQSTPDLIFADTVVTKIEDLVKNNTLVQIHNIEDHSTEEQLDIRLILKKGSDAEYVKQVIYKNTPIQDTKRVNMEVIYNDQIERMSYKAYIQNFIEFRRSVKFRLYNNRLQKVETRLHTIEVFIAILQSGDVENIVHLIRNQKPEDEQALIEWLMKKLKITDVQAKFILNIEIKRLSKGSLGKYLDEQKNLLNVAQEYIKVITTPALIDKEIEQELLDIKAKYGKPRQSIIISEAQASDIPQGTFKVVVSEMSFLKKMQINDPIKLSKGDYPKCVTVGDNDKDLLLFDEMGKVFRLPIYKIAFTDKNSPGIDIRMVLKKLTANIVSVMYLPILEMLAGKVSKYYIVSVTKAGLIKRMDLDDILNTTPSGILYSKLNKGDSISDLIVANHKSDVIVYTKTKALRISIESIPYLKRATIGALSIRGTEPVDGIAVVTAETKDVIIVTQKGKFNRISQNALPRSERNHAGSKVIKLAKGDSIKNIFTCNKAVTIRCIHIDGTITEIDSDSVPMGSSVSAGVKLVPKEIIKADIIVKK